MNKMHQVLLAHGSGGSMMKQLIDDIFFKEFGGETLKIADDAACLDLNLQAGERLAFSTDSFVVTPQRFPGADIGRLAVCGTVNDVASSGAVVKYLSCGFILEEGYPLEELITIVRSMAKAAKEADVEIVTGDTKVVSKGYGDGIYLNTSGIGVIGAGIELSGSKLQAGDLLLVSGTLGDHGITIVSQREELSFTTDVQSDAAPLNGLIQAVLQAAPNTHAFRDPTRGGLASTLNEFAEASQVDILIYEQNIPVHPQVQAACDMLGYDVLQLANEGKIVAAVPKSQAHAALEAMRAHPYGKNAAIIGVVEELAPHSRGTVRLETSFGSQRIIDMLVGEQLPRIC